MLSYEFAGADFFFKLLTVECVFWLISSHLFLQAGPEEAECCVSGGLSVSPFLSLSFPIKLTKRMLPFAATWMDLEGIILSEISHTEKDKTLCYHLYVESKI